MNKTLNIAIAYADESMKYSLKQIGIQLRYIPSIDKVILYTPKDLPDYILKSPLMKYKRGGGYWVWKPYLIWKTLQDFPEGTKVCYIDAGCTVCPGEEWDNYFNNIRVEGPDTLLFQYAPFIENWQKIFNCGKSNIEYWTKKLTLDYFDRLHGRDYHTFSKIWGGLLFCCGKNNKLINEWLDITTNHPELVCDPFDKELNEQYATFSGHHRHDQSILTPLTYYHKKHISVLMEVFDENPSSQIIFATRNHVNKKQYLRTFLKFHMQGIFGVKKYNLIKRLLFFWKR